MLLPFALTVMLPSAVIHAHELLPETDDGGHDDHHHHKGDSPKGDEGNKNIKFHSHDGQVAEYLTKDNPPLKQDIKAPLPAPPSPVIYPSRSIKPPLEPPSAI